MNYFIGNLTVSQDLDAIILLAGVTLGRGAKFFLCRSRRRKEAPTENYSQSLLTSAAPFLSGLVTLLVFASWWHLDMAHNYYHGPRWMGLWDNPNTYGMFMGAGTLLAVGLLAARKMMEVGSWKLAVRNAKIVDGVGMNPPSSGYDTTRARSRKQNTVESADGVGWRGFFSYSFPRKSAKSADKNTVRAVRSLALRGFLWIGIFMLGVGLVMSYSRGAWVATAIGLLYLAWCYGKWKWEYIILSAGVLILGIGLFWNRTPDSAPWYVKRADLGRPSAQNRATAWRAGLEIMWDHPLGVGWNNAVKIYGEKYYPPEGGPGALTTNDYIMLGTELGIPALLCFVSYCVLCLRGKCRVENKESRIQAACRAGAIVFLVAFWFDGGLFKLPTAATFWVLLELGGCQVKAQSV